MSDRNLHNDQQAIRVAELFAGVGGFIVARGAKGSIPRWEYSGNHGHQMVVFDGECIGDASGGNVWSDFFRKTQSSAFTS